MDEEERERRQRADNVLARLDGEKMLADLAEQQKNLKLFHERQESLLVENPGKWVGVRSGTVVLGESAPEVYDTLQRLTGSHENACVRLLHPNPATKIFESL